jgi:hypothetical protein
VEDWVERPDEEEDEEEDMAVEEGFFGVPTVKPQEVAK